MESKSAKSGGCQEGNLALIELSSDSGQICILKSKCDTIIINYGEKKRNQVSGYG